MTQGPILFDISDRENTPSVADAPAVPDSVPQGQAMQQVVQVAARKPSALRRWFWRLALSLLGALLSLAAWNTVSALVAQVPVLGWALAGLMALFVAVLLLIALREVAAIGRLGRVDRLRQAADSALGAQDLSQAQALMGQVLQLYRGRDELRWGTEQFNEHRNEIFDADALFGLGEETLMAPLDKAAQAEVQAAARQVATVTALVPLALADVAAALAANLRMIRRVAEIYGGRSGTIGSWRLTRAVFAHLVATGMVAAGEDLLEPILGGSVLSKLSRRFGEGLVNGALTARVGVAAMEVCRPLPFSKPYRPSVRGIIKGALGGLFSRKATPSAEAEKG